MGATGRVCEIDYAARRMVVWVAWHKLTLRVSDVVTSFLQRCSGDRLHIDYLKAVVVDIASATDAESVDISRFQLAVPKAALRGGHRCVAACLAQNLWSMITNQG